MKKQNKKLSSLLIGSQGDDKNNFSSVLVGRRQSFSKFLIGKMKDHDSDGIPSLTDCQPFNPKQHLVLNPIKLIKKIIKPDKKDPPLQKIDTGAIIPGTSIPSPNTGYTSQTYPEPSSYYPKPATPTTPSGSGSKPSTGGSSRGSPSGVGSSGSGSSSKTSSGANLPTSNINQNQFTQTIQAAQAAAQNVLTPQQKAIQNTLNQNKNIYGNYIGTKTTLPDAGRSTIDIYRGRTTPYDYKGDTPLKYYDPIYSKGTMQIDPMTGKEIKYREIKTGLSALQEQEMMNPTLFVPEDVRYKLEAERAVKSATSELVPEYQERADSGENIEELNLELNQKIKEKAEEKFKEKTSSQEFKSEVSKSRRAREEYATIVKPKDYTQTAVDVGAGLGIAGVTLVNPIAGAGLGVAYFTGRGVYQGTRKPTKEEAFQDIALNVFSPIVKGEKPVKSELYNKYTGYRKDAGISLLFGAASATSLVKGVGNSITADRLNELENQKWISVTKETKREGEDFFIKSARKRATDEARELSVMEGKLLKIGETESGKPIYRLSGQSVQKKEVVDFMKQMQNYKNPITSFTGESSLSGKFVGGLDVNKQIFGEVKGQKLLGSWPYKNIKSSQGFVDIVTGDKVTRVRASGIAKPVKDERIFFTLGGRTKKVAGTKVGLTDIKYTTKFTPEELGIYLRDYERPVRVVSDRLKSPVSFIPEEIITLEEKPINLLSQKVTSAGKVTTLLTREATEELGSAMSIQESVQSVLVSPTIEKGFIRPSIAPTTLTQTANKTKQVYNQKLTQKNIDLEENKNQDVILFVPATLKKDVMTSSNSKATASRRIFNQDLISNQIVDTASIQSNQTVSKSATKSITRNVNPVNIITPINSTRGFFPGEVSPMPPIGFIIPRKNKEEQPRQDAYDVFAKRSGKWIKIADNLTKRSALGIGASFVDRDSLSASFKIVRDKEAESATELDEGKGWKRFGSKFRNFMVRRGNKIQQSNTYIEKQKFRLDSTQEKRKIQSARSLLIGGR